MSKLATKSELESRKMGASYRAWHRAFERRGGVQKKCELIVAIARGIMALERHIGLWEFEPYSMQTRDLLECLFVIIKKERKLDKGNKGGGIPASRARKTRVPPYRKAA